MVSKEILESAKKALEKLDNLTKDYLKQYNALVEEAKADGIEYDPKGDCFDPIEFVDDEDPNYREHPLIKKCRLYWKKMGIIDRWEDNEIERIYERFEAEFGVNLSDIREYLKTHN